MPCRFSHIHPKIIHLLVLFSFFFFLPNRNIQKQSCSSYASMHEVDGSESNVVCEARMRGCSCSTRFRKLLLRFLLQKFFARRYELLLSYPLYLVFNLDSLLHPSAGTHLRSRSALFINVVVTLIPLNHKPFLLVLGF